MASTTVYMMYPSTWVMLLLTDKPQMRTFSSLRFWCTAASELRSVAAQCIGLQLLWAAGVYGLVQLGVWKWFVGCLFEMPCSKLYWLTNVSHGHANSLLHICIITIALGCKSRDKLGGSGDLHLQLPAAYIQCHCPDLTPV